MVIACNTASTIVLPHLRARYAVPFVGTVPAIKPACAASQTKRVSVLGTEATVKREYTMALIRDFAQGCDVTLVGSARLAPLAEAALREEPVADAEIAAEIAPCFVDDGGAPHRHGRARLHAFSAAARSAAAPRALAGRLDRPGAGDRAARGRPHRPAARERARASRPRGTSPPGASPQALAKALSGFGIEGRGGRPGDLTGPARSP